MKQQAVFAAACTMMAAPLLGMATGPQTSSVELKHRAFRTWSVELPSEQWFAVGDGIKIAHDGGDKFSARSNGGNLEIDTDGDGEIDRTIRATANDFGEKNARVVLESTRASGQPFRYGVRLRDTGNGWQWAPGGAMVGTLTTDAGPVKVQLFDRNGNGAFNDVGKDAMIVGRSNVATFLSRTINLDGSLWSLSISDDGLTASLTPYEGETSRLDLTSDFRSDARLTSAIVKSRDGAHSFDLARHDGLVEVPAGSYDIVGGTIAMGQQSVRVTRGRAEAIVAEAGAENVVNWGGPIAGEFEYLRQGDQVIFDPNRVWYFGKGGEEYVSWNPIGKSPEFIVSDKSSGEVLSVLILPGSC